MKLIVGLGNPGSQYAFNRHNVGFMVVDHIQEHENFPSWSEKFKGFYTKKGDEVLLKPQTFMNLSGESVRVCMDFFKLSLGDIWVVHDEIELPFGSVQARLGGGARGHNGLRSIDKHIGQDYHRIRFGVGRPLYGTVADYVLSNFSPQEINSLLAIIKKAESLLK